MENIYSIKHVFSHYSVMVRWVIGCEWKKELFRKKKALHIEAHSKVRKALWKGGEESHVIQLANWRENNFFLRSE